MKTSFPIIGLQNNSSVLKGFDLFQNYPNPFNPVTNIRFDIPLSRGVSEGWGVLTKLVIYDLLGREIIKLVDKELESGTYSVDWDALNYPSGVYFCKLEAGDFTKSMKMLIIK